MKKFLSCNKTAVIFLIVTIISIGFYAYMLARPISYGMAYHNKTDYEVGVFEGAMKFYPDGTMLNQNTTLNSELESRYYYKDGYIFYTLAQTDKEYEKEIEEINNNFDEAIKTPFYADEISSFQLVATEGDDFATVYTCVSAIVFAIIGGVVELALIGFTCVSLFLSIKSVRSSKATEMRVL